VLGLYNMKIGIDFIEVSRFRKISEKDHRYWDHVFTAAEWEYAFRDERKFEHLAGVFALKEAVAKAKGMSGIKNFCDIEIQFLPGGAPRVEGAEVSISHSQEHAVAVAVIV